MQVLPTYMIYTLDTASTWELADLLGLVLQKKL
ncbi:MAG: hypothetical protein ETSY2_36920 [Candidatus Entotheonella gemina]|uniref:Uncharacterized protein n=1 Tax=Candidatus Entotheonella gemina TaxID=1429439 RepID=W4LUC5_9BACT|nr:MAG: hypothetical protein ETSY2_36920 [Candidatus Entotheonella gemina]